MSCVASRARSTLLTFRAIFRTCPTSRWEGEATEPRGLRRHNSNALVNSDQRSRASNRILDATMTAHQLRYFRYLLRRLKDLYVEKEAMSCVLDDPKPNAAANAVPWREAVARMQHDAVYCSAIEANFAPRSEEHTS